MPSLHWQQGSMRPAAGGRSGRQRLQADFLQRPTALPARLQDCSTIVLGALLGQAMFRVLSRAFIKVAKLFLRETRTLGVSNI